MNLTNKGTSDTSTTIHKHKHTRKNTNNNKDTKKRKVKRLKTRTENAAEKAIRLCLRRLMLHWTRRKIKNSGPPKIIVKPKKLKAIKKS